MATLGGLRRPATARQRMGLGVALSAGLHALALVFLMVVVTRDPPRSLDNVATDEFVTIGPIGDSAIGIPGWPTDTPAPGPAVERAAVAPTAPTPRLSGAVAPGTRSISPRPVRRPVAIVAPARPPVARPAAPPTATAASSRGRAVAQTPAAPASGPRTAQAPRGSTWAAPGRARPQQAERHRRAAPADRPWQTSGRC